MEDVLASSILLYLYTFNCLFIKLYLTIFIILLGVFNMKPKLEDVAKLANVSKTTVSRVLNNRGYLSQKTIDKVNKAMKALDYQPNSAARQLFQQETKIIGLLFPTVANPFFGEIIQELERKLYKQGYKVIIGNSMNDSEKEEHYLNQLLSNQVDGLIVGTHNRGIQQYKKDNLPIVAIDRFMNEDIPIIESDNYHGGQIATSRLIEKGARKIVHTTGPTELETPAHRRTQAYIETMKKSDLEPIIYNLDFNISYEEKNKIFQRIFSEQPEIDGVFASNDVDAIMLLQIAQSLGKRVPEDFKIIGYDGTELIRNIYPHLTTIIQPITKITDKALDVLNQRLKHQETNKEYVLGVSLWEGTSS